MPRSRHASSPRLRPAITCSLLLTSLALACFPLAPSASPQSDMGISAIAAVLRKSGYDATEDEIAAKLFELGPQAIPALCEAVSGNVSARASSGAMARRWRAALVRCLRRHRWRHVAAALEARCRQGAVSDLVAALYVMEEIGGRPAVDLSMRLVGALGSERPPTVDAAWGRAVTGIAARTPSAFEPVKQGWRELDERLKRVAVLAAGRMPSRSSLAFLAGFVLSRFDPTTVLEQMITFPAHILAGLSESAYFRVRRMLRSESAANRRSAAHLLGVGHDVEACPALIPLLRDDDHTVRKEALGALARITGRRHPANPAGWRRIVAREEMWIARTWPGVRKALRSKDSDERSAALDAARRHRLYRDEVVVELARLLRSDDVALVTTVCEILTELGSPRPLASFLPLLERDEFAVRQAARNALRTITGRVLLSHPDEWREALEL